MPLLWYNMQSGPRCSLSLLLCAIEQLLFWDFRFDNLHKNITSNKNKMIHVIIIHPMLHSEESIDTHWFFFPSSKILKPIHIQLLDDMNKCAGKFIQTRDMT